MGKKKNRSEKGLATILLATAILNLIEAVIEFLNSLLR